MHKLQEELKELSEKLTVIQDWLLNHASHPDFIKIAGDRNHLLVKINAAEFKINNESKGLAILGESILSRESSNSQSQSTNGFKSYN